MLSAVTAATDARPPRPPRAAGRRHRTRAAGAVLAAVAVLGLTGCGQLRPGAAAVVGDQRISDAQVQRLADESLAAPGARAGLDQNFRGDLAAYKRALLLLEVRRVLAETSAARLGIQVPESEVEARYRSREQQAGGQEAFAQQLAAEPISPSLYRELVRTQVIESEIGYQQGGVRRLTESQLRAAYEQYLPDATTASLTLIQLPDAGTAGRVLAQVKADPSQFGPIGAQFSQQHAQPQPRELALNRLPADLAARLRTIEPNTIFSYEVTDGAAAAYYVIRFGGIKRPTLQSARPQLMEQTAQQAAAAGQKYVARVANDVGVDVNPRYGTWTIDSLTISEFVNPVVKPTGTPAPGGPGGTGGTGTPAPSPSPSPAG